MCIIARKQGSNISIAYIYTDQDYAFITQMEERYFDQDINILVSQELPVHSENAPVYSVGHTDLFEVAIKKKLK